VDYAANNGLFSGTGKDTFSPDTAMTRGMFVTVLGRKSGVPDTDPTSTSFSDVKTTDWFAPYVEWAAANGIVSGVGGGKFDPNVKISREQMATILYRYAQKTGNTTTVDESRYKAFSDTAKVSGYAVQGMKWATTHGILNGSDGKLDPKGTATRAQVAQVFKNSKDVLTKTEISDSGKEDFTPVPMSQLANLSSLKKGLTEEQFAQVYQIALELVQPCADLSREQHTVTEAQETDDGEGNIVTEETEVTKTTLTTTVSHKTTDEMADAYHFTADQREQLAELLAEENHSLWSAVLYGIGTGDGEIVTVALSQVGNVGGQPYWSWYGFGSRVEWCACFVSWCANECGYIDTGVIPKFAGCVTGSQWFKDRGLWQDKYYEPRPGDIIFFDWDNKGGSGPQDGEGDHVGIVEKVENGTVYTIEGNSGDACCQNAYSIGYYEILGYGCPAY